MKFFAPLTCWLFVACAHHPAPQSPAAIPKDTTIAVWHSSPAPAPTVDALFLFPLNVDTLTAKQAAGLKLLASKANAAGKPLTITGYADTTGSEAYNLALGRRRAVAVHASLALSGCIVPLSVASYGELSGYPVWSRKVTVK